MKRLFERDHRTEFRLRVESAFAKLKRSHSEGDVVNFNDILKPILPGVRRYISRRINQAVINGSIPSGKFKAEDIVADLYQVAYDNISEVKRKEDLRGWLIHKADELLHGLMQQEDYDDHRFERIDTITEMEWQDMQSDYTTDANGEPVMMEELDDPSYPRHEYTLADVFVDEDEVTVIEKISGDQSDGQISQRINNLSNRLPASLRTVFNLVVNHGFSVEEIAEIKQLSKAEVVDRLNQARHIIKTGMGAKISSAMVAEEKG